MTTDFCKWLRQIELSGKTYLESGIELMLKLKELIDNQPDNIVPYKKRAYINHFIDGHKIWFETMKAMGVK